MRVLATIAVFLMVTACSDGASSTLSSNTPESIATKFVASLIKGDLNEGSKLVMPKTVLETLIVAMSNELQALKSPTFSTKPCVAKTKTDDGQKYFYCEGILASDGEPYIEFDVFLQEDRNARLKAVVVKTNKLKKS